MDKAWAGVDAGKEFHYWAHVLDASGRGLLSRKVENDEADILKLIDEALSLAEEVVWALDQPAEVARHSYWHCSVGAKPEGALRPRPHRRQSPRYLPR
jgi:predicted RNase H-like nuclease